MGIMQLSSIDGEDSRSAINGQDQRPALRKQAQDLVSSFVAGEGSLNELIYKTAKEKGYTKDMRDTFTTLVNKEVIDSTGMYEFDLADPAVIAGEEYKMPSTQKVAYMKPEFRPRVSTNHTKTASEEFPTNSTSQWERGYNLLPSLRSESVGNVHDLRNKKASLTIDCGALFKTASEHLAALKLIGFSNTDLRDHLFTKGYKSAHILNLAEKVFLDIRQTPNYNVKVASADVVDTIDAVGMAFKLFLEKYASLKKVEQDYSSALQKREHFFNKALLGDRVDI